MNLAVTFHHGEEEFAQTDPGAVAVLLRFPARLSGAGGRFWGPLSGLGRDDGGAEVQLEVRCPGRAFAQAGLDQGAVVGAHSAGELFKRSGHLFPEGFGVGLVPGAELRFAVVLAPQLGDATRDARPWVLAVH